MNQTVIKSILALSALYMLSGCAATQVALSKKNLDVQTKMSATLFLDPIDEEKRKTIYVVVKNTSDKSEFQISDEMRNALQSKGFKVVSKMNQAAFVLQVNVLQVGKADPNAAEAAMYKGYGADGVALGAGAAYVAGGSDKAMVGAGILGGIASVVADSLVKDVHFSVITDVQIKERLSGKGKAQNTTLHYNESGTSGGTFSSYSEKSEWKIYQTRILSSANKVNLEFAQAAPELKRALVQSISGIF
ncbi:complement resistance protein TraT [Bdellovibrio sp. BCCA]|uniref:complement resistance protein TraT n=1 Tax=unclassified Bdellovibrio TaxID=2633795 RepID=UPI0025F825D6|nr:complement resistance protein TraT [uncultured Bdellovibrio sp.]